MSQEGKQLMFNKSNTALSGDATLPGKSDMAHDRRRSVLHEGITIRGEWSSDGIVDFGGTFIGDLHVETLILARGGNITGNVSARMVTVEGKLEGTISALTVVLKSSAHVTADISAQTITIDEGAEIEGKITCNGDRGTN
jgi:cytoskeletal protein CcmA (bactofilin family)